MEGRSPEFSPEMPEKTDDGFSEAKSAKVIEGKGMDTKQVKKTLRHAQGKAVVSGGGRLLRPLRIPRTSRQRVVGQSSPVSELSRKEKIIQAVKVNTDALLGLVDLLRQIDGSNFRQEEQALDEIREKRRVQEELLQALLLEQRHQLTEEAISKEVWELIK